MDELRKLLLRKKAGRKTLREDLIHVLICGQTIFIAGVVAAL